MGKVGEKLEGLESYLWVVLEREEVVRGGGSTAGGGRRRYCAAVAAFRRGVEVMAGPVSFARTRASGFGGWWRAGRARSTARRGGATGGHGELCSWRDGATRAATASGGRRRARGEREGELERVQERTTRRSACARTAPWPTWPR